MLRPWLSIKMMVIICKDISRVSAGSKQPPHQHRHPPKGKGGRGEKKKKKRNQPNRSATALKLFHSKDNLAAKFLGGINLFSAYPMAIHAGYKILDYFLLG